MKPKPFSRVEREWIEEHLGQLSVREMAERLGRPKSTVGREVMEVRADVGLPMPPDPRWPDRDEPDPPDGTEGRLLELAARLRAAMLNADEKNLANIARQYRDTLRDIERLRSGRDGDGTEAPAAPARDDARGRLLRMAIDERRGRAGTG